MAVPFLDTNFLLRHIRQDVPEHAAKALRVLASIEAGHLTVLTSDTVVFETVFTLERSYHVSRSDIADAVLPLVELSGIELPGKRIYRRVFELYLSTRLGFADSYHVALMERLGMTEVFSLDTDFDRVPGIQRREE